MKLTLNVQFLNKAPWGKDSLNSHFGQSVHALEDIFGQRLKVVVSQTPIQQREKNKTHSD